MTLVYILDSESLELRALPKPVNLKFLLLVCKLKGLWGGFNFLRKFFTGFAFVIEGQDENSPLITVTGTDAERVRRAFLAEFQSRLLELRDLDNTINDLAEQLPD